MVLLAVFFLWSLTVQVDKDRVKIFFGPGLIQRTFWIKEIEGCDIIRIWPVLEWGISYYGTKRGWVFSVSGSKAVQLTMKNGKRYRIGTDEPDKLNEEILKQLSG